MRTSQERLSDALREKTETLNGERGDPNMAALRVKDLAGFTNALAGTMKTASGTKKKAATIADTLAQIGQLVNTLNDGVTALQGDMTTAQGNISTLQTDEAATKGRLDAAAGADVPGMSSTAVSAAPTQSDFNALRQDVANLHAALLALISDFS